MRLNANLRYFNFYMCFSVAPFTSSEHWSGFLKRWSTSVLAKGGQYQITFLYRYRRYFLKYGTVPNYFDFAKMVLFSGTFLFSIWLVFLFLFLEGNK